MDFFSINRNLPCDSSGFLSARASQVRSFEKTCLFQTSTPYHRLPLLKKISMNNPEQSSNQSTNVIKQENSPCATNSEKALPILWLDFGSVAAPFALFPTCPVNRSAHLSRDELQTGNSWRAARAKHHKEQSDGAFA